MATLGMLSVGPAVMLLVEGAKGAFFQVQRLLAVWLRAVAVAAPAAPVLLLAGLEAQAL
nr:hypothetical protein [Agrobacterium salinitolerans]